MGVVSVRIVYVPVTWGWRRGTRARKHDIACVRYTYINKMTGTRDSIDAKGYPVYILTFKHRLSHYF